MISMDVTVAERGQIVIPKEARDAMGLKPGAKLQLRMEGGRLWIEKKVSLDLSRWIGAAQDDDTGAHVLAVPAVKQAAKAPRLAVVFLPPFNRQEPDAGVGLHLPEVVQVPHSSHLSRPADRLGIRVQRFPVGAANGCPLGVKWPG